jgi:hypothetical protein
MHLPRILFAVLTTIPLLWITQTTASAPTSAAAPPNDIPPLDLSPPPPPASSAAAKAPPPPTLQRALPDAPPLVDAEFSGIPETKLAPTIHREPLSQTLPSIPLDAIRPFLSRPRVMSLGDMEAAPKIIGFIQGHMMGGVGDAIYVTGMEDLGAELKKFEIVRIDAPYIDPDSGENLGYQATYVGDAEMIHSGDPAKLVLTFAQREVNLDDRVLPAPEGQSMEAFVPIPGPVGVEGTIISVLDGVNQIGLYSAVVLNKGEDAGLAPGHLLQVTQQIDPPRALIRRGTFSLPSEEVGTLMIFRTFDRVSYALVMRTNGIIRVGDTVHSPDTMDKD